MSKQRKCTWVWSALLVWLLSACSWATTNWDQLEAYYPLNETDGVVAYDAAGDNDANLINGPVWDANGFLSGCLSFDGVDDYVQAPFVLDPNAGAFSAFAWVKGGGAAQDVLGQQDDSGGEQIGRIWLYVNSSGYLSTMLSGTSLSYESAWDPDDWHHVGIVWDGALRHLYLDGIEVVSDSNSLEGLESTDGSLYIGAHKTLSKFWDGVIDDVRIYSRALTDSEIMKIAGAPVPIVYLPFNNDANDISGNNYHGTVYGEPNYLDDAISMDGVDDYVSLGNPEALNPQLISIASWIKMPNTATSGCILGKDNSGSRQRVWQFKVSDGKLALVVFKTDTNYQNVTGLSSVNDGQWHYVAGTWDGEVVKVYVDGVCEASESYVGTLQQDQTNNIYVGRLETKDPLYFEGQIDELQIFTRALSADEVVELAGVNLSASY